MLMSKVPPYPNMEVYQIEAKVRTVWYWYGNGIDVWKWIVFIECTLCFVISS